MATIARSGILRKSDATTLPGQSRAIEHDLPVSQHLKCPSITFSPEEHLLHGGHCHRHQTLSIWNPVTCCYAGSHLKSRCQSQVEKGPSQCRTSWRPAFLFERLAVFGNRHLIMRMQIRWVRAPEFERDKRSLRFGPYRGSRPASAHTNHDHTCGRARPHAMLR